MRRLGQFLAVVVAAVVLAAAVAVSLPAFAGDRLLGVILVTDGGTASNATTGYGSAGCAHEYDPAGAGACAQSFRIGANTLLSVQCKDQGAKFRANWYTVDAGQGITLAADQFLTTSVGQSVYVPPGCNGIQTDGGPCFRPGVLDGGEYNGGVVSISPLAGAARAECNISQRTGNE